MDPRAAAIREGYATIAQAYREHLLDELAGKPLDRAALEAAGFSIEAQLEREPYPDVEYPSRRAYLLARRR